jgi:uncharacterized repeat protein (TIGR03803 family)
MSKKHLGWAFVMFLALAASLQAQFNLLHSFMGSTLDGEFPYGSLVVKGSTLYWMTCNGGASNAGTIFKINVNGTGFMLLHSFVGGASDGKNPYGSLVLRSSTLYGMTFAGGANNLGTIFKINVNGTGFKLLHAFAGGASDGASPFDSMIVVGSVLYGMTFAGGLNDLGTIFKINPNGTGFKLLHAFAGGTTDGAEPYGALKYSGANLYGMTSGGGTADLGTIFKISPSVGGFALIHSFAGGASDGAFPYYGSFLAINSVLYGMTNAGGADGRGVIFKINPNGSGFALLHSFTGGTTDGSSPSGSLILSGGTLYGITNNGGAGNYGTIFKICPNGTGFGLQYTFARGTSGGAYPYGGLLRKVSTMYGTMFYGLTNYGGVSDFGTVFSYKLK